MGQPLVNFTDFMKYTPPVYISGPSHFINEAVSQSYLLEKFLKGRSTNEVLQGGSKIRESLMLDDASTFEEYQPNASFTFPNPQVITNIEIDWRFWVDKMSWTDHQVMLNVPPGATKDQLASLYKNEKFKIEQRMWTSLINGMESRLFRSAHGESANMESETGTKVYSIPAFITEDTTNFHADGWTTVEGIDPAAEARWRNQVVHYDAADPDDSDGDSDGLFDAFHKMFLRTKFKSPGTKQRYFENPRLFRMFIACSEAGHALYSKLAREAQDRFVISAQDAAFHNPTYNGIELVHVTSLDTAPLYADGLGGFTDEQHASKAGPRYWWINANYLKMVYHTSRFMETTEPQNPSGQPFSWYQVVDTWGNMVCTSRQRQGIVAPA